MTKEEKQEEINCLLLRMRRVATISYGEQVVYAEHQNN